MITDDNLLLEFSMPRNIYQPSEPMMSILLFQPVREPYATVVRLAGVPADSAARVQSRFEQYRRYRTFFDRKSVNHALCGIEVLETQKVLASFPEDEARLILEAIRYHNGLRVPDGLDERTRRFAQMLRDADKLDIYRVVMEYYRLPREERNETVELDLPDLPAVSDEIVASIRSGKIADYGKLRTVIVDDGMAAAEEISEEFWESLTKAIEEWQQKLAGSYSLHALLEVAVTASEIKWATRQAKLLLAESLEGKK
jgi:hypothetical protein